MEMQAILYDDEEGVYYLQCGARTVQIEYKQLRTRDDDTRTAIQRQWEASAERDRSTYCGRMVHNE